MIKISMYILFFFLSLWSLDGLNINKLFKQSRVYQARITYMLICISISYLVTNFIYDFITCFK